MADPQRVNPSQAAHVEDGTGTRAGQRMKVCQQCRGSKQTYNPGTQGFDVCAKCGGDGYVEKEGWEP